MATARSDRSSRSSADLEQTEIYICVACGKSDRTDDIVACDRCDNWWHFSCAGVDASVANHDWVCPRCLPPPTISASVRSTTSSRKAALQRKRLAEQHELEKKQLELEKRQLLLQKKHSQEKYDLEESLADEDADNRSVRSRVIEIESREREKQVQDWVDKHASAKQKSTVTFSEAEKLLGQPTQENGSGDDTMNTGKSPDNGSMLQSVKKQLKEHKQQQQPLTVEQLLLLEAELRRCRLQMQQMMTSGEENQLVTRPDVSKGAIPKTIPTDRDNVDPTKHEHLSSMKNKGKHIENPISDPRLLNRKEGHPKGKSRDESRPLRANSNPRLSNSVPYDPFPTSMPRNETKDDDRVQTPPARSSQPRNGNHHDLLGNDRNLRAPTELLGMGLIYDEQPRGPATHSNYDGFGGNPPVNQHSPRRPAPQNRPSPEQLAARQVMPRDLPDFSGDPEEWPIFYSSFYHSTAACGFNNVENLARLQRCLKGNALKSVRYYLLSPDSVTDVVETLRTLYGRPEVIINRLIKNVQETPAPKPEKLDTLIDFGMSVRNLTQHLIAAGQQAHLSNPALLQELVEKLPANIKLQWAQHLMFQREASLRTFSNFMATVVESVSKVVIYTGSQHAKNERTRGKDKGFVHAHTENHSVVVPMKEKGECEKPCLFCGKGGHRLKDCTKFQQLSVDDRWKNVQSLKICRSCLNPHGRRTCRISNRCGIDGCQFRHHLLLHGKPEPTSKKPAIASAESHVHHHFGQSILFRIIPVTLYGKSKSITVFAFLDEGSSATLIERSLVEELGVKGPTIPLCLKWTANMTRTEEESQVVTLEVSKMNRKKRFQLMNVRTVGALNLPSQTLRFADLEEDHPHLKGLPVQSYESITPKLLVGLRNLQLVVPQKIREGSSGIVAAKTRLGWCVYGSLDPVQKSNEYSYHVCECEAEERLDQLMKDYFNAEDCGVNHPDVLESKEEKRARKIMEETTSRAGDRFETGLLWRTDYVELPDSYSMAMRRLQCLEKRMERNPLLKESIHRQVMEYQEKGYAHRATEEELAEADPRRVWYLPLGVVCNPKKPGKIRLIWDAAAKVDGMSLNSFLLPGPDLLVPLPSVQFRFRQYPVAVSGDIKEMFHQANVIKRDQPSQSVAKPRQTRGQS